MTINQVIEKIDTLRANAYDRETKINWLDECERQILTEAIANHELSNEEAEHFKSFTLYNSDTPGDTELLVKEPYSNIYFFYLMMQIDLHNLEYEKYNNSSLLYGEAFSAFARMFNREHMPISKADHWHL